MPVLNFRAKRLPCFPFLLFLLFVNLVHAQEEMDAEAYTRAVGFLNENLINKKVFNLHIEPHWFADSSGLWYEFHSPSGKKYLQIDLPGLDRSEMFDHETLARILTDSLGKDIDPLDLPLYDIERRSADRITFRVEGKEYLLNTKTNELNQLVRDEEEDSEEIRSHNGEWEAFAKDYNLFVRSTETGKEKQLSHNGRKGYEYATWYGWSDIMEGEGGQRPPHFGAQWSPDDEWIYANALDLRSAQKMYLLDWSIDTLYRPKLLSYYRGSPGDTGMVYVEPVFYHVESGHWVKPDLPRSTHINSIGVRWSDEPGIVYLENNSRGFQNLGLYRFHLESGELETLYEESSPTNIDNFSYQLAEGSGVIFFLSEKSGWRQLYQLDLATKAVGALTRGEYFINAIERVDEENEMIYFSASGKEAGVDPYQRNLYRISFEGGDPERLTPEDLHHAIDISPDGKYFLDNYSTVNMPTVTVLRSMASGDSEIELGHADFSGLEDWQPPQPFSVLAEDDETELYGALWKPTTFDPAQRYPIIDASYTGPHTFMFPIAFRQAFTNQALAELGFIVMRFDGRGSANRSKAFHDHSYKNLGGGLADHIHAMRKLAEEYPWVDTTRVGIFGHSAGGYDAAHGVLAYPDFYKVAVASSADHDHRMEKAWWPEMYMGWPVDSAYHRQSNITLAGNLKGKLLITHGGIDENVNPSATFKLAEALVQADKPFDMKIFPSQRHGYRGQVSEYFRKLRWNYFIEHLLGKQPRWKF